MRLLLNDLRYAARAVRSSPTFASAAALTLAIGLGANAAMFSATYNLLLKPLPYPEPARLTALSSTRTDQPPQRVSLADLLDWQSQSRSFTGMAAYRLRSFGLRTSGTGDVSVIQVGQVTHGFFPVLGVEPALGRAFRRDEEEQEAAVIVLSDALWHRLLGAERGIVGRTVRLNDEPYVVLGVLPPGFGLPVQGKIPEAYIPLSHKDYGGDRSLRSLAAIARLRPGVTAAGARAELQAIGERLARSFPDTNRGIGAAAEPLSEVLRGRNRRPLFLLSGAAFALLLIAATNVAHLLVVRVLTRSRTFAIRSALGARSRHLGRQFFAEGLLLTLMGAVLGLLLARAFLQALPLLLPLLGGLDTNAVLALSPLRLDAAALLFTLLLGGLLSAAFGLLPVLMTRRLDVDRLLRGDAAPAGRKARLHEALVAGQIALSTLLLLSSGLLLRSFFAALATDPGFQTREVVKFGLGLPEARYDTEPKMIAFHRELLARLREIPGVRTAGAALSLPLSGRAFNTAFQEAGAGKPAREWPDVALNVASPGFFTTLGIPVVAGRPFREQDTADTPRVLLVNRAFEQRYFPKQGAVGARLEIDWESAINPPGTVWEAVGVVGDIRQRSLEEEASPEIYLPMSQFPLDGCAYVVRTARSDAGLAPALRAAVAAADGQLEKIEVLPLTEVLSGSLGDRRLMMILSCSLAAVSLLLTAIGLYGVVAYTVAESVRGIAVRMALGIQPLQVIGLVARQGLRLTFVGLSLGLLGFLLINKLLVGYLYGVGPVDLPTVAAVMVLLALVTCLACAAPALRARRIAPALLLREI